MKTVFVAALAAAAVSSVTLSPAHAADIARIGAAWQPVYGLPPAKAVRFMPALRQIGGSFSRVTLYWTQLEPKQGAMRWDELDAYLEQIDRPEEAMLTITSASPWATRVRAALFPSSPAKNPDTYYAFVRRVVTHCAGRVRYFQADTEPSDAFYWAGTASDYAAQQRIFYRAVKDADPHAIVVLGGSNGLFDPSGDNPLPDQAATIAFLKTVLTEAKGAYDVFDLHLYADPYTIPDRVAFVQALMRAAGDERPIIASEVSGPAFFEIKANRRFATSLTGPNAGPEAVRQLRKSLDILPIEARMFLAVPDSEAGQRLRRIQSDDLMVRNVLAFAAGVERTAWFDIWHDNSNPDAPSNIINSPTGLFEGTPKALGAPTALGTTFGRVARVLGKARSVTRIPIAGEADAYVYRIKRTAGHPLLVAWRRPADRGGILSPVDLLIPRAGIECGAQMLDGNSIRTTCSGGHVQLALTDQPVIIGAL